MNKVRPVLATWGWQKLIMDSFLDLPLPPYLVSQLSSHLQVDLTTLQMGSNRLASRLSQRIDGSYWLMSERIRSGLKAKIWLWSVSFEMFLLVAIKRSKMSCRFKVVLSDVIRIFLPSEFVFQPLQSLALCFKSWGLADDIFKFLFHSLPGQPLLSLPCFLLDFHLSFGLQGNSLSFALASIVFQRDLLLHKQTVIH